MAVNIQTKDGLPIATDAIKEGGASLIKEASNRKSYIMSADGTVTFSTQGYKGVYIHINNGGTSPNCIFEFQGSIDGRTFFPVVAELIANGTNTSQGVLPHIGYKIRQTNFGGSLYGLPDYFNFIRIIGTTIAVPVEIVVSLSSVPYTPKYDANYSNMDRQWDSSLSIPNSILVPGVTLLKDKINQITVKNIVTHLMVHNGGSRPIFYNIHELPTKKILLRMAIAPGETQTHDRLAKFPIIPSTGDAGTGAKSLNFEVESTGNPAITETEITVSAGGYSVNP